MRPVTTEALGGDVVVVNKGVAAGETVVTDGQVRLVPGASVAVKGAGEPARAASAP
jgi:multidrug efflux system membrane fusion protein